MLFKFNDWVKLNESSTGTSNVINKFYEEFANALIQGAKDVPGLYDTEISYEIVDDSLKITTESEMGFEDRTLYALLEITIKLKQVAATSDEEWLDELGLFDLSSLIQGAEIRFESSLTTDTSSGQPVGEYGSDDIDEYELSDIVDLATMKPIVTPMLDWIEQSIDGLAYEYRQDDHSWEEEDDDWEEEL